MVARIEQGLETGLSFTTGGRRSRKVESALRTSGAHISEEAFEMLRSRDFPSPRKRKLIVVQTRISDLGINSPVMMEEVLQAARLRGLEEVPAEIGPHIFLSSVAQQVNDLLIGMRPISVRGVPHIFNLVREPIHHILWLDGRPATKFNPVRQIALRLK